MPFRRFARWLLAVFCLGSGALGAVNLPLRLTWDSANEFSYARSQPGKERNWSEFYQFGIVLDSLSYQAFSATLELRSRADFLSYGLEVNKLSLAYQIGAVEIAALSEPSGYGKLAELDSEPRLYAGRDDYRYQATRFDQLRISWQGISLASGGSSQNRAMLKLGYQAELPGQQIWLCLAQEARMRDSHWGSPVMISSAALNLHRGAVSFAALGALSHFIKYENTPEHNTPYLIVHAKVEPRNWLSAIGTAEYQESEPLGQVSKVFAGSLSAKLNKLVFTPGVVSSYLDKKFISGLTFSADWHFLPAQRVGLLYRCQNLSQPVHSIALQAQLSYNP